MVLCISYVDCQFKKYIVLCKNLELYQTIICLWSFSRYLKMLQYFRVINYYLILLRDF